MSDNIKQLNEVKEHQNMESKERKKPKILRMKNIGSKQELHEKDESTVSDNEANVSEKIGQFRNKRTR